MSKELSNLVRPTGANRAPKIKGRGIAGGSGKTAGRGMKGQNARKSGQVRLGFEGGQMPLQRRLPKRGFHNPFEKFWAEVKLSALDVFAAGSSIDIGALRKMGIVKGKWDGVKLLGNGDIAKAINVRVNRISKSAQEKIEKAGGKVELIADRVKWKRPNPRAERRAAKKKAS